MAISHATDADEVNTPKSGAGAPRGHSIVDTLSVKSAGRSPTAASLASKTTSPKFVALTAAPAPPPPPPTPPPYYVQPPPPSYHTPTVATVLPAAPPAAPTTVYVVPQPPPPPQAQMFHYAPSPLPGTVVNWVGQPSAVYPSPPMVMPVTYVTHPSPAPVLQYVTVSHTW